MFARRNQLDACAGRCIEADGLVLAANRLMLTQVKPTASDPLHAKGMQLQENGCAPELPLTIAVQWRGATAYTSALAEHELRCASAWRSNSSSSSRSSSRLCGGPPPLLPQQNSSFRTYAAWSSVEADEAVHGPGDRVGFHGQHALGVGLPMPEPYLTARASTPSFPRQLAELDPGTSRAHPALCPTLASSSESSIAEHPHIVTVARMFMISRRTRASLGSMRARCVQHGRVQQVTASARKPGSAAMMSGLRLAGWRVPPMVRASSAWGTRRCWLLSGLALGTPGCGETQTACFRRVPYQCSRFTWATLTDSIMAD